jgi:hypothetical protein
MGREISCLSKFLRALKNTLCSWCFLAINSILDYKSDSQEMHEEVAMANTKILPICIPGAFEES